VRRHRQLGAELAELKAERDALELSINDQVQVGWQLSVDGVLASKRAGNRSFDMVTAISLLDAEVKKSCVVTSFDSKLVREAAKSAGVLDDCMLPALDKAPVLKLA
jgi:hypothetical protein